MAVRMDDAESGNVGPVLDRLTLRDHRSECHEDFAGELRIPHEAAREDAVVDELLALTGRERAHDEDFAVEMFLGDCPGRADRTLAAESEEALQVRIGAHEVESGAA